MRRWCFFLAAIGLCGCADMEEFFVPEEYDQVYSYQPVMAPPPQTCPGTRAQSAPIAPTSYSAPTAEPELANPGRR